jgi:hypothetical protein
MVPVNVNSVSLMLVIIVIKTELYEIQTALVKDPGVSVNRVIWSPDGSLFGKLIYWNFKVFRVI